MGALGFTEQLGNNIGRVASDGMVTEYAIPTAISAPQGIVAGADGNIWLIQVLGNAIGRITLMANPIITDLRSPTVQAFPAFVAIGLDGNLWFTEFNSDLVGRLTPSSACTAVPGNGCSAVSDGRELNGAPWVEPSLGDASIPEWSGGPIAGGIYFRDVGHGIRRGLSAAA